MKTEHQFISQHLLFYLATCFLLGSSVIFLPGSQAENNSWLALILGTLEGFLFLAVYTGLARQYPGKNLVQINELVFGSIVGKALSWLYSLYFLYVSALLLRTFASFFSLIMTKTPLMVFLIVPMLASAFAIRSGLAALAKYSQLVLLITTPLFVLNTMLLTKEIELSNLLPFMDIPMHRLFWAMHTVAALPYGQSVVFLMFMDSISEPKRTANSMKKAFLFAGTVLLFYSVRTTAVLGSYTTISVYPNFAALRIIDAGEVFTRLETISGITFLTLGFVKGTMFYFGAIMGVTRLLKKESPKPLVLPLGALLITTSWLLYDEYIFDLLDATMLFPIYSMVFALFLPLLALIVAKIRMMGNPQETDSHG